MNPAWDNDRIIELTVDCALVGLSPDGQAELAALRGEPLDGRALELEVAAAAVMLAQLGPVESLPPHLAERLSKDAEAFFAGAGARGRTVLMPEHLPPLPTVAQPPGVVPLRAAPSASARGGFGRYAGWLAAAACFLLAVVGWLRGPAWIAIASKPRPLPIEAPSPGREREALLAHAKDIVRVDWTPATDPAGRGVSGDVVWSPSEQGGFLRFRGLATNDPRALEYQLWIFDGEQDERYPIDGGVFDVDTATGDVVVPIVAKLKVARPTLFAVTIEKPGGVVVSKRDRLVVTAAIRG